MPDKQHKRTPWRLIFTIITIVAMLALVFALRTQIADTIKNLSKVNAIALLLMIPAQVVNYHAYARFYQVLFRVLKQKVKYWQMVRVTLELNFVNNLFPSGGVSGFSYFRLRMRPAGVSTAQATIVQVTKFIFLFVSFQIMLVTGLILLAVSGGVNNFTILVAASIITLLMVGTFFLAFIIGSKDRINAFFTLLTRAANRFIHIFRPKHPETINIERVRRGFTELHENYVILRSKPGKLRKPLLFALLANASEIATIYVVYIAFGHWVNPGAVIIAYAIANFAGFISVLPGGVGIYEALMTAVLATAGVPPAISLPVTVMYRILNMLIQFIPGYILYHGAINNEEEI